MAFLYIVRARGDESGPFAEDGAFVLEVLTQLASLTGDSFSFDQVEAFTFSSGVSHFNVFINSISSLLNIQAVYGIDPRRLCRWRAPAAACASST